MYRRRLHIPLAVVLAACCLFTSSLAFAAESHAVLPADDAPDPTAEAMLIDLVFLRPFGFIATVVGSAVFVVSLPFTVPTKSVDSAARKLVQDPVNYTFVRPFGHTDFGLGYERRRSETDRIRQ